MQRIAFTLAVVFLAVSSVIAQDQEPAPTLPYAHVASRSQAYCTGFIASPSVPRDLVVVGGADDDFHSVVRQFVQGESIYTSQPKGVSVAVGNEYSVVRPADEMFLTMRYQGERSEIRKAGTPYEDVAQVRVTHVGPEGIVAEVTFSCSPIVPGDVMVPFQPRPIPTYTISPPLDHFIPMDKSKEHGRITATNNNFGFLGRETVVYLNLGEKAGTQPGNRFRIYKILPGHTSGVLAGERTPPEVIGEAVVLSVQSKSCVAMVVSSYREISSGDYVEKE